MTPYPGPSVTDGPLPIQFFVGCAKKLQYIFIRKDPQETAGLNTREYQLQRPFERPAIAGHLEEVTQRRRCLQLG